MSNGILNILLSLLGIVLTIIVTWGANALVAFLNSKIKNEKMRKFLSSAIEIVATAVKATYQTYVEAIKGTEGWTKEAQEEALQRAYLKAKSMLSTELLEFIKENYGDVEIWLKEQIEAQIYSLKNC